MFRFIFYLINIMIIVMIIVLFASDKGLNKNKNLEERITKLEKKHQLLIKKSKELKNNIKLFKESESYQKHVIRKEMGFVDENDMIYIFDKK